MSVTDDIDNTHEQLTAPSTLKDFILAMYISNPNLTLKKIAEATGASYGYVRNVISRFKRRSLKTRGRAFGACCLGVDVHGVWFCDCWLPEDYEVCPLEPVRNRNRMKLFRGRFVRFMIFPGGRVVVYPLVRGRDRWRRELIEWLSSWLPGGRETAQLYVENLKAGGQVHAAFQVPPNIRLPRNLRIKWPDLGLEVGVDDSPWGGAEGQTLEIRSKAWLSQLPEELLNVKRAVNLLARIVEKQGESLARYVEVQEKYAEQIRLHLRVMQRIEQVVAELEKVIVDLRMEIARLSSRNSR